METGRIARSIRIRGYGQETVGTLDGVPQDIDPADVDEVQRRVVDPILGAMFKPGELSTVSIAIELADASWWEFDHFDEEPQVWLRLTVGDEQFEHRLCKPGFWLDDATWIAGNLEDKLNEWICETSFGWGELRSGPDADAFPGPPEAAAGVRSLSVHLNEVGQLPLWEAGEPADISSVPISATLVGDLLGWQQHAEQLADEAEESRPASPRPGPSGLWVQYVSERSALTKSVEAERRRERALAEWHAWVDDLQISRDALVARLRDELGPGFTVVTPPRLPALS